MEGDDPSHATDWTRDVRLAPHLADGGLPHPEMRSLKARRSIFEAQRMPTRRFVGMTPERPHRTACDRDWSDRTQTFSKISMNHLARRPVDSPSLNVFPVERPIPISQPKI